MTVLKREEQQQSENC